MAKRITGIGAGLLKHMPWLAVVLAVYQYYKDAGGFQGLLYDIKNVNMTTLQGKWTNVAIGIAFFMGADIVSRYIPGKLRYVAKAVMYYLGASQMLEVLNAMYYASESGGAGAAPTHYTGVRGY